MFTVYILYSEKYQKSYIGFTSNLEARLYSHNEMGHKGWTIKFRPWQLVFTESFSLKSEAMSREKFLKTGQGRQFVHLKIRDWLADRVVRISA